MKTLKEILISEATEHDYKKYQRIKNYGLDRTRQRG
jgi:hypothetical protein